METFKTAIDCIEHLKYGSLPGTFNNHLSFQLKQGANIKRKKIILRDNSCSVHKKLFFLTKILKMSN